MCRTVTTEDNLEKANINHYQTCPIIRTTAHKSRTRQPLSFPVLSRANPCHRLAYSLLPPLRLVDLFDDDCGDADENEYDGRYEQGDNHSLHGVIIAFGICSGNGTAASFEVAVGVGVGAAVVQFHILPLVSLTWLVEVVVPGRLRPIRALAGRIGERIRIGVCWKTGRHRCVCSRYWC
ncbi:hypothetical protein CONLIGDRAFT_450449 [Coniochaeta ligniaria NRRL 30616]|uniref:Uncharacterized protein n=1 Tax=Coniochaeta ligniaria NRRL 30616 TaxID=1408157 RepID=A0A1J7IJI9_9PEZI|nr:hypothetical protein CONLIGDRAFT_450449 [Coniochaeta ligniaria NRRL 30616]